MSSVDPMPEVRWGVWLKEGLQRPFTKFEEEGAAIDEIWLQVEKQVKEIRATFA